MSHKVTLKSHSSKHSGAGVDAGLISAYSLITDWLQRDNDFTASDRANFEDTSVRAAKALIEMAQTRTSIAKQLRDVILCVGFPLDEASNEEGGLQLDGPILLHSFCPHHLMLVVATCWVAYIPKEEGHVLGLSKLPRLAQLVAKRPVLQEQLAVDIANILHYTPSDSSRFPAIETEGSIVLITGKHACVSCRGVESQNLTTTVVRRGVFLKEEMESKFYQLIATTRASEVK